METEMRWTLETYRLDEVARKFDLPCVVSVNEGFYSDTESEGFSQGDIMSIDARMVLHKVAANFAEDLSSSLPEDDNGYIELTDEKEILVPLNYKGKLKVLRHIKNFDSVRELAIEFPRYAKLRKNLKVETEDKKQLTISAGTVIELDRTLPGSTGGGQGKLVIQFSYMRQPTVVALPINLRGQFRTVPDETEYTIKEAIDRYSLPQHVRFIEDEIKRVYTQDLVDGIENMKTITETLRLNRLVTQEVLVGHYKPVEGAENRDSERFKQRTLVVLPTDNPEIRDIDVNVLLGVTEDIYSDVFLVRNVSNTEEIVDGSLYIDFVMSPGVKRISAREGISTDSSTSTFATPGVTPGQEEDFGDAPPVPPRREKAHQPPGVKPKAKHKVKQITDTEEHSDENYEEVSAPISQEPGIDFTLAGISFEDSGKKNMEKKKAIQTVLGNIFQKKMAKVKPKKYEPPPVVHPNVKHDYDNTEEVVYDEVDEGDMRFSKKGGYDTPPHPRPVKNQPLPDRSNAGIPVARVLPTTNQKAFIELTIYELGERLNNGKMVAMANFCRKENLNGSFFKNMSKEDIQNTFPLNQVELVKFLQMRDENWIPPP